MYDVEESRSWWRRKVISIAAMVVSLAIFIAGSTAVLAGPAIIEFLDLPQIWRVLRWPLAFLLVAAVIWVIYFWLPNHERSPSAKATLAGAACAATLWTVATLGFKVYISHFGSYSKTYGLIGGIMVLLLWLYFTAFSVLLGGESAATLEQRSKEAET
jgi:membrane protein